MSGEPKRPKHYFDSEGVEWKIKFLKLVRHKGEAIHGLYEPDKKQISLRTGVDSKNPGVPPPSDSEMAGTLLHELLHLLFNNASETEVEKMEFVLSATIRRNKPQWYWILRNL